jgi:uncharacterized membrane protein YhaH (DUF805 family)
MIERVKRFFRLDGRLRRRDFWIAFYGVGLVMVFPEFFALNATTWPTDAYLSYCLAFGNMVLIAPFAVRRAHDLNLSGWYALTLAVPIVGFIIFFLIDGTHGQNRFGPSPKRRPTPGVA